MAQKDSSSEASSLERRGRDGETHPEVGLRVARDAERRLLDVVDEVVEPASGGFEDERSGRVHERRVEAPQQRLGSTERKAKTHLSE